MTLNGGYGNASSLSRDSNKEPEQERGRSKKRVKIQLSSISSPLLKSSLLSSTTTGSSLLSSSLGTRLTGSLLTSSNLSGGTSSLLSSNLSCKFTLTSGLSTSAGSVHAPTSNLYGNLGVKTEVKSGSKNGAQRRKKSPGRKARMRSRSPTERDETLQKFANIPSNLGSSAPTYTLQLEIEADEFDLIEISKALQLNDTRVNSMAITGPSIEDMKVRISNLNCDYKCRCHMTNVLLT